jgi:uncharacterized protein involved in type VI secretion and phage assembly
MSLLDLLEPQGPAGPAGPAGQVHGVVTGVVTNNQDPEKLGRVRVRFPWLSGSEESAWARVASPMAGKERGLWILPEVDDEVLVAFERGDPRFPYVLGALWSSKAPPPETNEGKKNDVRVLRSRSGHVVRLDDTDGEERIEIVDGSGKNSITISTGDDTITVQADGDVTIRSTGGKLVLEGKGIELKSEEGVKVEAGKDLEMKSGGRVTVKGSTINLN